MLDNMPPGQKQLLIFGGPVVAAFALISVVQKKNQPIVETPATGATIATQAPDMDAIGVSQLSEFESLVTSSINQLATQVAGIPNQIPAPIVNLPGKTVANVKSEWYSQIAPQGTDMVVLGQITPSGYKGVNVGGGAPVYANVNGTWQQNFDISKLAVGTALGTLSTFKDNVDPLNLTA